MKTEIRQKFVVANWKMRTTSSEARQLAEGIVDGFDVDPKNAAAFLAEPGMGGVVIGGASLSADEFLAIINAAIVETHAEMQAV